MKIIFKELEPGTRGKANGMYLRGKKEYDGTEYEKFFFDKTQQGDPTPVMKQLESINPQPGDCLELKYDASKFKNLESVEKATASSKGGGGASGGSGRSRGKSGGNYRNPDHTDRSSAMYLAWEIVSKLEGIDGSKKIAAKAQSGIIAQFEDVSKKLTAFVQTGEFVEPREPGSDDEKPGDAPSNTGSADDDDDIPF